MNVDTVLSIVMLAAIALIVGAIVLWRRTGEVRKPALMVLLALIAMGNVLIWIVPAPDGVAPIDREPTERARIADPIVDPVADPDD